ncbi:hypothetical protein [Niallia circulans]|uniref:Uncharacterized protein n=1 Tax=Niallia circulans TaxID=1397 RepID=A0A941GFM1_NIACI|nr:hypothetical protein [Niallia circulans]MCB5237668.1 hypothetical protein [Niallia circulans]
MKKLVSTKANWLKKELAYFGSTAVICLYLAIPSNVYAEEAWKKAGIEKRPLDEDFMRVVAFLAIIAIIYITIFIILRNRSKH